MYRLSIVLLFVFFGLSVICVNAEDTSKDAKTYLQGPQDLLDESHQKAMQDDNESRNGVPSSKQSPTGSDIYYVRSEVESFEYPTFEGTRYEDTVPATLNLARRAELLIHGITNCNNPDTDYEIYGWLGHIKPGTAMMHHSYNDYNGGQAKWMMNLPLARTMSGSMANMDVDVEMMKTMFRMIGEDGLYYIPVIGAPWHEAWDSAWAVKPGVEQHFDSWPNGRALLCLVTWYARDPESSGLKANIERMIQGFLDLARGNQQGDAGWLPAHFTNIDGSRQTPLPVQGILQQATVLPGAARYYGMTGYPPARELCELMVNYWLGPSRLFDEEGRIFLNPTLHFHGTTFALGGLLDWALATYDEALLTRVAKGYEQARSYGQPLMGWFPEAMPALHAGTEPCGIGDMTMLASRLSQAGAGDYWEDVERYTRNILSECQITENWMYKRMSMQAGKGQETYQPNKPLETTDRVAGRMLGVFSGMSAAAGETQTVCSHCCTGNAFRGMYYAWKNIVSVDGDVLNVNLLLNRSSKWADVDSYLPYQGQVDVHMKQPMSLRIRIPSWVDGEANIDCLVDGQDRPFRWEGRYIRIEDLKDDQKVSIRFPIYDKTVEAIIDWTDQNGEQSQKFFLRMRGFDIVDLYPRPENIIEPFFAKEHYRHSEVLWEKVERFAPENDRFW